MAPNSNKDESPLSDEYKEDEIVVPQAGPRKYIILYYSIFLLSLLHIWVFYGFYLCLTSAKWATILFNLVLHWAQNISISAGTHRLWSHRAYKAKLPLQVILMLFHSLSCQSTIISWSRSHRIHHKYTDTDADPHNAARGFFFSHIGWLLVKKHPENVRRSKTIDVSDLRENPVVRFQEKYFLILAATGIVLTTIIPIYSWGENELTALSITILRIFVTLHIALCGNSIVHIIGYKPYEKNISATQIVPYSVASMGEGFHNYHHAFPFDYQNSELGNNYFNFNVGTRFIDFFAWIGWAYDCKTATDDMIVSRMKRTGDGTDLWGRNVTDF